MPQPAAEMIDRHSIQQIVPGVAVPQSVSAYALTGRDRAHLLRPFHRCLHPAPCRRGVRLDYPALPHASIRQRAHERRVQLRMYRYKAGLAALAGPDSQCGMGRFQRQVAHFEVERLGYSQAGAPLLQHQKLCLRVWGETDDGVDLVGIEVPGEFPDALWIRAVLGLGIAPARPAAAYNLGR